MSTYNQPNSEKFVFTQADFSRIEWKEVGREFEWNQRLYDVSGVRLIETGVEITCVNDTSEESFIALFSEWKKSTYPATKTKIQCHPQFCIAPFSPEEFTTKRLSHILFTTASPSVIIPVSYPPPKFS